VTTETAAPAGVEPRACWRHLMNLDSFGPQIEGRRSPDERISIPTVERFWGLLAGVADEFSTV